MDGLVTLSFSIRQLADFVIYCLGIIVLVILIVALIKVIKFVKRLDKLVADNTSNINSVVDTLPEVMNNINDVSTSIKDGIGKAEKTVDVVGEYLCDTVTTVTESTEGLFDILSIVQDVMKTVVAFFQGKDK